MLAQANGDRPLLFNDKLLRTESRAFVGSVAHWLIA